MERSSASDRKTTFACTQKMSYILAHSALLIYNVILQYLSLRIVLFLSCCVFLYFVLWTLHSLCGSVVPGTEGKQALPTDRGRGAGHSFEAGFNYTYPYRNRPCSKFLREFLDGNFGVGRLRSSKISSCSIFKALWASTISVEKHSSRTNCPPQNLLWERKQTSVQWASTISLEGTFIHLAANLFWKENRGSWVVLVSPAEIYGKAVEK